MSDKNKDVLDGELQIDEIIRLMPYRYPMLMLDRVIRLEKDQFAIGVKNVSFGESFFSRTFSRPCGDARGSDH